jgi:hypothetical protein
VRPRITATTAAGSRVRVEAAWVENVRVMGSSGCWELHDALALVTRG